MEKSMKRVEKLVHATSSALAQMKFSLMFDELSGGMNGQVGRTTEGFDSIVLEKFLGTDDLNLRQNEFKLQASETLAKLDKMSALNELNGKTLKPIDRIKEINRQINCLKLDQSKQGETRQSRQKLLSLISEEKFSPETSSCKESIGSKHNAFSKEEIEPQEKFHSAPRKIESSLGVTKSPIKSKAELKNRILETQEIVDRGFQTARLLAQKVESMTKWDRKDRTPSTGKTVSEINLKSLEGKTESSETIKTGKCGRRHSEKNKKRKKELQKVEKINTRVIDIKRNEFETDPGFNLRLQNLPSLHIRSELKMQKIHNLEIPASAEIYPEKSNNAISFFSHEQMEREKVENLLKKLRKENCSCLEDEGRTNYVECFNCGNLIKVRETWVDPRKIDEVLRKCNFNVFDPRIDEFVEKYGGVETTNFYERSHSEALIFTDAVGTLDPKAISKDNQKISQANAKEKPEKNRLFTLRDLSDQLCKKYRKEADILTNNHLKLNTILQDIFRKVEESREFFEAGNLIRNLKSAQGRAPELTVTKPVLVNLPGVSLLVNNTREKLDKKDVVNKCKERTDILGEEEFTFSLPFLSKSLEAKEKEKLFFAASTWENKMAKTSEMNHDEMDKSPSLKSPSSRSSLSPCEGESNLKGKKIKKTLIMDSVPRKNKNRLKNKSLIRFSTRKSIITKSRENKKEEKKKERPPSATSSSSDKSKRISQTDLNVKGAKKDTEVKNLLTSPLQMNLGNLIIRDISTSKSSNVDKKEEKAELCQTSSEKSENNYESDFESFTNEQEEQENDCEDEEPVMIVKKLSTISEVDSELEKKVSNDQKVSCFEGERNVEFVKQKEDSSVASDISVMSQKTERIPAKASGQVLKGAPTELVTSLKDVLSALQDQFARTESLAEKLAETSKVEREKNSEFEMNSSTGATLNPWKMSTAAELVENLQSSRKYWSPGPKPSFLLALPRVSKPREEKNKMFEDVASEEGGSSLGEIILSEEIKNNSGISNAGSISEVSILNSTNAGRLSLVSSSPREIVISSGHNLIS